VDEAIPAIIDGGGEAMEAAFELPEGALEDVHEFGCVDELEPGGAGFLGEVFEPGGIDGVEGKLQDVRGLEEDA